jgi:hypothetical protein
VKSGSRRAAAGAFVGRPARKRGCGPSACCRARI